MQAARGIASPVCSVCEQVGMYEILWSMYEAGHPWASTATDFALGMEDLSHNITDITNRTCGNMLPDSFLWEHWFGPAAKTAVVLLEIMLPSKIVGRHQ